MLDVTIIQKTLFLTLNRPEKRNALNNELVGLLKDELKKAKTNPELKLIVIRQNGAVFSAGADLSALQKLQTQTFDENLLDSQHLAELFELIYDHPLPILSAIQGDAIAGGCGLATVCDISLAVDTARFAYTETRIGFIPAIVSWFVVKKVGDTFARRLLLAGELFKAPEAYQMGLITEVCTSETFSERLNYWVHLFETKVSRESVKMTKELISHAHFTSFSDFSPYAASKNAEARGTDDCKRGISAFLNKEKITW
jgi:methylglutaconyl-CoA hydratase